MKPLSNNRDTADDNEDDDIDLDTKENKIQTMVHTNVINDKFSK